MHPFRPTQDQEDQPMLNIGAIEPTGARNDVCPVYSKEPRRSLCIQLKNAKLNRTSCDNKLRKRGIRKFCPTYMNIVVIIEMS